MTAEVCRHCGGVDNWHHDLTECVTRLRASLAVAHACIEAADEMRGWATTAPQRIWDSWDTARAEYERVTKGEGER